MKSTVTFFILSLLSYNFALAESYLSPAGCIDCFNFVAPTISGAESIVPPEIGLIVFDSYVSKFRGFTSSGKWSTLSKEESIRTIATATSTLYSTDDIVKADATANAVAIVLPSPSLNSGKMFTIKKVDSTLNAISILPNLSEKIDGFDQLKLGRKNQTIRVISDGTNWLEVSRKDSMAPTVQKLNSGTGATYNTPAGVTSLRIRMIGGGGGGGGCSIGAFNGGTGGAGGVTTFSALPFIYANGGLGGGGGSTAKGGNGNFGLVQSPATGYTNQSASGASGVSTNGAAFNAPGGMGASTFFGGQIGVVATAGAGGLAPNNTGAGGGGATTPPANGAISGGGGGAGAYTEAYIANPDASYPYTIGSGGTGGSAGNGCYAGGNGGSGFIEVTEYYN